MASHSDPWGGTLDPDLAALFAGLQRKLAGAGQRLTLRTWMDCAESWRILEALREARGNRSAAARALGIGRRTLGIQPSWGPRNGGAGLARSAGSP